MAGEDEKLPNTPLEQEKLTLEVAALKRAASWRGQLIAWLQAAAIPASIAGVLFSFFFSTSQLHQAEDARTDDRFDKALTRLASTNDSERISGVSGLRLFISNGETSRRSDAVQFLVDALANETSPVVQSSILSVIGDLESQGFDTATLNSILASVVDRDRSLTQWLQDQLASNDEAIRELIIRRHWATADDLRGPIPDKWLKMLTPSDFRNALQTDASFAKQVGPARETRLRGLSKAVELLVRQHAVSKDFSGIFCENCDFTPAKDLSNVKFDGAFLGSANFSHMLLVGASFRDAELSGTNFFAAHLEGSHLNDGDPKAVPPKYQMYAGGIHALPLLACAHLDGADLSGLPLVVILKFSSGHFGRRDPVVHAYGTSLNSATVDRNTRIDKIGFVYERLADEAFLNAKGADTGTETYGDRIRDTAEGISEGVFRWFSYAPSEESDSADEWKRFAMFDMYKIYERRDLHDYLFDDPAGAYLEQFMPFYLRQAAFRKIPWLVKLAAIGGTQVPDDWKWVTPPKNDCEPPGYPGSKKLLISRSWIGAKTDLGTR